MPCFAERARVPIQAKSEGGTSTLTRRRLPAVTAAASAGLPEPLRLGAEALGGFSLADVKVHRDSAEPAKLGALAFARGGDIHLGPGQEQHLPHEAWHVVQQKQGRVRATARMNGIAVNDDTDLEGESDRMAAHMESAPSLDAGEFFAARKLSPALQQASILDSNAGQAAQLRRIPKAGDLASEVPSVGPGFEVARKALARVLSRAWGELPYAKFAMVKAAAPGGLVWNNEEDLVTVLGAASRPQLLALAEAIRMSNPAAELGDIFQMETRARPGTDDSANLKKLLEAAVIVFDEIIAGGRDKDLEDVFGLRNVVLAKKKYTNAKKAGQKVIHKDRLISDRSGFSDEVGLGGYSWKGKINLPPWVIDSPTSAASVITFIHECTHSGNSDVNDYGYATSDPMFTRQTERFKLKNAAHYEVAPRRKYGFEPSFPNTVFTPAAASGEAAVPLSSAEEALQCAGEVFRKAWDRAVDVHSDLLAVARHPRRWYTTPWVRRPLLSWSLLAKLTIHERRSTFPPTWSEGFSPITSIDIALSEGVVRKIDLAQAFVPKSLAYAETFIDLYADPSEKAQLEGTSDNQRADKQCAVIVKLVTSAGVNNLTGSLAGDLQLVKQLAADYKG